MTVLDVAPDDYNAAWDRAIKDATYAGDVAYDVCHGPLKVKSQEYTKAFTEVMDRFRRRWHCPECGSPCPTGRCAHCQGE